MEMQWQEQAESYLRKWDNLCEQESSAEQKAQREDLLEQLADEDLAVLECILNKAVGR